MDKALDSVRASLSIAGIAATLLYGGQVMGAATDTGEGKRVVLVGASIGKEWHIERIRERVSLPGYRFDYLGTYEFDKGPLIAKLVSDPDKPAWVMIKECSTYFPGDEQQYRRQVMDWVGMLRAAGIQPVLVTTAPIAEPTDYLSRAKLLVKRAIGRQTTLESITRFNDWLKQYARGENIPVFDLEAELRRSDKERWLRSEFDAGDRIHLTQSAYRVMDDSFAKFLVGPPGALKP